MGPLSPMQSSALNIATPQTARHDDHYEVRSITQTMSDAENGDAGSSPFQNSVDDPTIQNLQSQENASPSKQRHSRILSGAALSPLKILQTQDRSLSSESIPEATATTSNPDKDLMPPPKSPRKTGPSPVRRFPVRVSSSEATPRPRSVQSRPSSLQSEPPQSQTPVRTESPQEVEQPQAEQAEQQMSLEDALKQNEGLKHAIDIFDDDMSGIDGEDSSLVGDGSPTVAGSASPGGQEEPCDNSQDAVDADDTMASTFSTFSALPNMTMFARMGRTPTQNGYAPNRDPRRESNTTNLLDFTENLRFPDRNSPAKTMPVDPNRKTPQRQSIQNLLDFDIPPMPTPRSVPSISARELESLKSNFMSEISGLKASLSGKEAEANSLKVAIADAEKRAGQSLEELRDERSLREQFFDEKETWEKRGKEMETILRKVKDEIMITQREREELEAKLDESEQRREAAEMMAQEAESKMAGMRAGRATGDASPNGIKSPKASQRDIENAVERVARELHAAYKNKHESKVVALKKSYENRWDKKMKELESKIEDLTKENEELRIGRDATLTKVDPNLAAEEERKEQAVKDSAQIRELSAEVVKLEAVVKTVQQDNSSLRGQLEQERVEKGELVTLAEELMQMQSMQSFVQMNDNGNGGRAANGRPMSTPAGPTARPSMMTPKKVSASPVGLPAPKARNSMIGRGSGLKAPSSVSGIGRPQSMIQPRSGPATTGIARPGSGMRGGGLMSSIEKMGSYRGRAE